MLSYSDRLFRLGSVCFHVMLDRLKALGADDMLNAAGIVLRGGLVNAKVHEHAGQNLMALKDPLCNLKAGLGEGNVSALVNVDKSVIPKVADIDTDAGLGEV